QAEGHLAAGQPSLPSRPWRCPALANFDLARCSRPPCSIPSTRPQLRTSWGGDSTLLWAERHLIPSSRMAKPKANLRMALRTVREQALPLNATWLLLIYLEQTLAILTTPARQDQGRQC